MTERINKEQAAVYDRWHETETGTFALAQEKRLLQHFMAPWTRRQQKLLEVGCGPGRFLQFFWESGFDVSGLDASPAMLELARERLGNRAELHLGQAEHLPFRDKEFDVVALLTLLEFCPDPEPVLQEALRVARKAVLVTFLNKHSLYALARRSGLRRKKNGFLRNVRWFSWWEISALLRKQAGPRPMISQSVLIGPQRTWSAKSCWRKLNCRLWPPFVGAYAGVRYDLVGDAPLTPIMAWKEKAKLRPMEQPASSGANRSGENG
ncbi:class I SAM-dependent methyltransferase [Desulfonatronum sp. SC1]|uniref:class I SAM-dependent methyltransferase n=1 Tax=Desulfonatronum sp. SC1 TaxID=2109626 RepID=UPI000D31E7F0|nr:class I SAM-dependent methyltransferase [Desulfonatronum sp. SC1]PTN31680.1 class I SAM-dependent methyltransferase [Desulfonatronum sp. SC1]